MNRPRTLKRHLLMVVAGGGAALLAACGTPSTTGTTRTGPSVSAPPAATADPSAAATPSTAASPSTAGDDRPTTGPSLPHGWRRCVNTVEGFSIAYPGDWYTTEIRPREVCRQFHPTTFVIPREGEYPLTALNVGWVDGFPGRVDTEFDRVLRWEQTTVAGRPAVRVETESTGAGQDVIGTRRYGYTIRHGNRLISVFAAAEPGATGYPGWKAVVDQAARTIRRL